MHQGTIYNTKDKEAIGERNCNKNIHHTLKIRISVIYFILKKILQFHIKTVTDIFLIV